MGCLYPNTVYWTRDKDGKRGVTFNRNASFSGIPFKVPCGQCIECRLAHSRMWAVRCMHEYRTWYNDGFDSSFVTLTYDDKHLDKLIEEHGCATVVLRDLQLFMKRLRKATGKGVRFYACGEYGSRTRRPHYHVLLFNRDFSDKKFYGYSGSSEPIYTSDRLRDLWPAGDNKLGAVSFNSCAYVARYICDKITGDMADDHYMGHKPEFCTRSLGIGKEYLRRYGSEVYRSDSVIVDGREMAPPRYYDIEYSKLDLERVEALKVDRRKRAILARDRSEENNNRRRAKECFALKKLAVYARGAQ